MSPEDWKVEIVECGDLVQDDDTVTPPGEAERRWNRYVELADSVTGDEGPDGVAAIVASLKAADDYGAYQASHAALARFPNADLGKGMALAAEDLLAIPKDASGNVLLILAHTGPVAIDSFIEAIGRADSTVRANIRDLVEFHEAEEWLTGPGDRGVIRVPGE